MKYDVIITGAGTAGLTAAYYLSKNNYKVLVIEKSDENNFGNHWCNDVEVNTFKKQGFPIPNREELSFDVDGDIVIRTLDNKIERKVKNTELYPLKMSIYQKRLKELSISNGADIIFNTEALDFIYEDDYIKGLKIEGKNNKEETILSEIVILACNDKSPILKKIPEQANMDFSSTKQDSVNAIQELYKIDNTLASEAIKNNVLKNGQKVIYTAASGAFSILMYQIDMENGLFGILSGTKSQNKGIISPRTIIDNKVNEFGFCKEKEYGGGRSIALRYSLDSMVYNGLVILGDAAFMVNPQNGSGTYSSMLSAKLISEVIINVFKSKKKPSTENLWPFNVMYQTNLGSVFAGYYIQQKIVSTFSSEDVQLLHKYKVIRPRDMRSVYRSEPIKIGLLDGLTRFINSIPVFDKLLKMLKIGIKVQKITKHYKNYPSTYDHNIFESWKKQKKDIISSL